MPGHGPMTSSQRSRVCWIASPAPGVTRLSHASPVEGQEGSDDQGQHDEGDDHRDGGRAGAQQRTQGEGEDREQGQHQPGADDGSGHRAVRERDLRVRGRGEAVLPQERLADQERRHGCRDAGHEGDARRGRRPWRRAPARDAESP